MNFPHSTMSVQIRNISEMRTKWKRKKSRAYALIQKFHHSTLIPVIYHHCRVRKWSFQHHLIHFEVSWYQNDHRMTNKSFHTDSKWQGWPRDEVDQNLLHGECFSFHGHSCHSLYNREAMGATSCTHFNINLLSFKYNREARGATSCSHFNINLLSFLV